VITEEALERVEDLLEELRESSANGVPVLVEGSRDEESLRELGIQGPVLKISGNKKTALNFLEGLAHHKQVIVLTDFDRTGGELARFCSKHLRRLGVEPIADLRERLKVLLHRDVKDIQGLAKFLRGQRAVANKTIVPRRWRK